MVNPLLYVALVCLIAASAFFSSTETAFSTVSRIKLRFRAENGGLLCRELLGGFDKADRKATAPEGKKKGM